MNKRISTILILSMVIILAVIWAQPALAGHQWILLHHEDQGIGQPAFEKCMPEESWEGHDDHEDDWFKGPYDNNDCTNDPTEVPTDEPTPTSTEEPQPTPTDEPTEEPTIEPTSTDVGPDDTPTEPVPTEGPGDPEPTVVPGDNPCPSKEPCGWLFFLIGPDGQQAWFASFSLRGDGTFYLPSSQATLACLGWVAISAPYGRPIYAEEAATLTHCWGGSCAVGDDQ